MGDRRHNPLAVYTGDEQHKIGSLLHVISPQN
jgi:hypothetical protein